MYEIVFHYHERDSENKYNTDVIKTYQKKVNKPKNSETVPLDRVASLIISQLSRRDVWVINVEVFEYSRRQVSFKETKNGVILKNKKYTISDTLELDTQDILVEDDVKEPAYEPQDTTSIQPVKKENKKAPNILRYEIYTEHFGRIKGFTDKKRYPVLKEIIKENKLEYKTIDDNNNERIMNSFMFDTEIKGVETINSNSINLSGGSEAFPQMGMPTLRR